MVSVQSSSEIYSISNAFVIEVGGETAGIVARDGRGFRFYAATQAFDALDGRMFAAPGDAERAARRHANAKIARRAGMLSEPPWSAPRHFVD
jgi:hypothetical protein